MKIIQQFVKRTDRISAGKNLINYITIHETDNSNKGASAQAHANLQSNGNSRKASWHYQVDDQEVIQSFPDTAICWHAENGNSQSIGIEICVNSDGDYQKAVENAVSLVKVLMERYNLNTSRVVQHNFWTGKNCPRNLRSGAKGIYWSQFKKMLSGATNSSSSLLVLKYGDVGDSVKLYQDKLKRAGYSIVIDGSFGPEMLTTVKQFQQDKGLVVDGYLGPATQKILNSVSTSGHVVLKYGDVGDSVKLYQDKLKRAGYSIVIDGSFGPAMRSVVQQFQRDNGLVVDGYLGPATQKKLNEILVAIKNKLDEDPLNLNKTERAEISRIFKKARELGVFSSAEHENTIVDGTMTMSRLQYLQTIIAGAGINGGKRIK